MVMFIVYLLIVGMLVYFISLRKRPSSRGSRIWFHAPPAKSSKSKDDLHETWKQVYETGSMDEARSIKTRLEEEGIDSILYEQGKKDIHGNLLKGVGVAVPNTAVARAQASIAKMPV